MALMAWQRAPIAAPVSALPELHLSGPKLDSAAACACAMLSSMVSGPIAAPATYTPGREVSPR